MQRGLHYRFNHSISFHFIFIENLFIQGNNSVALFTIGPVKKEKPNYNVRCLKE